MKTAIVSSVSKKYFHLAEELVDSINRLVRHLVNHDEIYQPFMMLLTLLLIIFNINFYHKKKLHIFKKFFIN